MVDPQLLEMDGRVWFFDFIVISVEMGVLIFMGGVSSVAATASAKIGFLDYLVLLLVIDIVWVVLQWLLGKPFRS